MDSLREEDRSINHHGTTLSTGEGSNAIQVRPAESDLVARREDVEVDARKRLYEQMKANQQLQLRVAELEKKVK